VFAKSDPVEDISEATRALRTTTIDTLLWHARTCTPLTHFAHLGHDPSTTRLATELGATANFSGNLGDILFHCLPAAPAGTEYLQRHGPTRAFFKHVLDAAERDRVSFWQVLRDALRDGRVRPSSSHWIPRELRGFGKSPVIAEVIAAIRSEPLRFVHPRLHSVDDIPLGKVLPLTALAFDSFYNDLLLTSDDPEPVRPFIR
jgi:hypothetical protein